MQESDHWSRHVTKTLLSITNIHALDKLSIGGGAENGQFCWINNIQEDKDIEYHSGELKEGEILLEIQGQKVVGYTLYDIRNWLQMICNSSMLLKSVHSDYLTKDLKTFLGTRFVKNSIDHDLQQVIRVNIYRRTVPCTTRPPRSGEVNGVDYRFVSMKEFEFLEKNNYLLESGNYEGNRYGTPKPLIQNMEPLSLTPRNSPIGGLQKLSETVLRELPHGWEKVENEEYGIYYIDHINKRTQLEHPEDFHSIKNRNQFHMENEADIASHDVTYFTTNPDELVGTFVDTKLIKSSRGLGFTIVGGSDANTQNFLQIKGFAPEGPAALNGKLETSDVLVSVNEQSVLGSTQEQVTELFREIPIGGEVRLLVCRGYPLSFDPQDPNNEIITTVAVSSINQIVQSNNSIDTKPNGYKGFPLARYTVCVQRGSKGFGFTVVDGNKGQKVKDIRDKQRCSGLCEGDLIEFVDGIDVRSFKHAEFVDLLKSKPQDHIVEFNLLRNNKHSKRNMKREGSLEKHSQSNKSIIENVSPNSIPFNKSIIRYDSNNDTNNSQNSSQSSSSQKINQKNYIPSSTSPSLQIPSDKDLFNSHTSLSKLNENKNNHKKLSYHELPNSGYYGDIYKPNYKELLYGELTGKNELGYHDMPNLEGNDKIIHMNKLSYRELPEIKSKGTGEMNYHDLSDYQERRSHIRSKTPGPILMRTQPVPGDPGLLIENDKTIPHRFMNQYNQIEQGDSIDTVYNGNGYNSDARSVEIFPPGFNRSFEARQRQEYDHLKNVQNMPSFGNSASLYALPRTVDSRDKAYSTRRSLFSQDNISVDGGMMGHPVGNIYRVPFAPQKWDGSVKVANQDYLLARVEHEEFPVRLFRHANGFGFRIIGGVEENSQICVGHVLEGGAAAMDGRLKTGDEIISINGARCIDISHLAAVQMMGQSAKSGFVDLVIRRRILGRSNFNNYFDVELSRSNTEGFGFVILSSTARNGSVIGQLIEGSPAQRCGKLAVGDNILAINGIDVRHLQHTQVVQLVKDSGTTVRLTISSSNGMESRPHSIAHGSPAMSLVDTQFQSHLNMELIQLNRGLRGFGFSIRGGVEFEMMPLFVLKIAEGGVADLDGRLRVGDEICEINGQSTAHMSHVEAVKLIQEGGFQISLLVRKINLNNKTNESTTQIRDISTV